jgi:hypothetical protein
MEYDEGERRSLKADERDLFAAATALGEVLEEFDVEQWYGQGVAIHHNTRTWRHQYHYFACTRLPLMLQHIRQTIQAL